MAESERLEDNKGDNENAGQQLSPLHWGGNVDWYLEILIGLVNRDPKLSFGITLFVGGTLISGDFASRDAYSDGLAQDFQAAGIDPQATDALFKRFGDAYAKLRDPEWDERGQAHPDFIHLKDARVFHPGAPAIPRNRAVFWRGRLNAVDGFILGKLSAD